MNPATLKDPEHIAVIAHCVKAVAGRIKVIAGTGSNETNMRFISAKRPKRPVLTGFCW